MNRPLGHRRGPVGSRLLAEGSPRELTLTLDDVLIEDGKVAPFSRFETTYAAMGRFGADFLVNGETDWNMTARTGEVIRFYLTNTANTRVFSIALPRARMKLVGGDSGRSEHEQFVQSVVIAPSERVVIDVLFSDPGPVTLEHRTPKRTYALGCIAVSDERASPLPFDTLRSNPEWAVERRQSAARLGDAPDKTLALVAEMDMGAPDVSGGGAIVYYCPMHPEVTSDEPGKCPKCRSVAF